MVVGAGPAGRPTKTCYSPAKPVLSGGPRKSTRKFHSGDQYLKHNIYWCPAVLFYYFIYFRNSDWMAKDCRINPSWGHPVIRSATETTV